MINITDKMVRRFIRDFSIPAPVQRKEFLEYYLRLYDKVYDTKRKFEVFMEARSAFQDDESFLDYRSRVRNDIINDISNNEKYISWTQSNDVYITPFPVLKKEVFIRNNANKTFLSFDLKAGNFSVLRYIDKSIVRNYDTWEEYVRHFSPFEYFQLSKHFRQVTLGKLDSAKRIKKYEYVIMSSLIQTHILNQGILNINDIVMSCYDEVIFDITNKSIEKLVIPKDMQDNLHVEVFTLQQLLPYNMFVKKSDEKITFKCCNVKLFPQIYKHYMGLNVEVLDKYFIDDTGHLSKYIEELQW